MAECRSVGALNMSNYSHGCLFLLVFILSQLCMLDYCSRKQLELLVNSI